MHERNVAAMKPVVQLLGWLLLLKGVGNVAHYLQQLYNYLHYYHTAGMDMAVLEMSGIYSWHKGIGEAVIAVVAIVVGLGLIKLAPWARRTAIVLLLCMVVYRVLTPVLSIQYFSLGAAILLYRNLAGTSLIIMLLRVIPYLLGLVYLASPPMRTLWQESRPPSIVSDVAEKVMRVFPRMMSPLFFFLGITLLCWALAGLVTGSMNTLNIPRSGQDELHWFQTIPILENIPNAGLFVAGVLLLFLQRRGRLIGMILLPSMALLTGILYMLIFIKLYFNDLSLLSIPMLLFFLRVISNMAVEAVPAYFLWKMVSALPATE